ncbi:CCN family member 1 isoform X1 [Lates japonicus]|uniref:CCN family member 1 isoform X1 n=1 Tax=Lates japonicus TaxID=270547 RepID=A0AAD3MVF0_LATJO|nr:CCN family member 1 isoform X1 [Lates japonicus]
MKDLPLHHHKAWRQLRASTRPHHGICRYDNKGGGKHNHQGREHSLVANNSTCIDGAVAACPVPCQCAPGAPSCPAPASWSRCRPVLPQHDCHAAGTTVVSPSAIKCHQPGLPSLPLHSHPAHLTPSSSETGNEAVPYKPKREKDTMGNELVE